MIGIQTLLKLNTLIWAYFRRRIVSMIGVYSVLDGADYGVGAVACGNGVRME